MPSTCAASRRRGSWPRAARGCATVARLWDVASAQPIATLEGHTDGIQQLAFSPHGTRLATAAYDETVRLWDAASGQLAATFEGHTDAVTAIAFSPDGARLASAGYDDTVRLWDAASGQATAVLEGHTHTVSAVAFSPDGTRLASAAHDGIVWIWDAVTHHSISQVRIGIHAQALAWGHSELAVASDRNVVVLVETPRDEALRRRTPTRSTGGAA